MRVATGYSTQPPPPPQHSNPSRVQAELYGQPCAGFFGYSHLTGGWQGGQAEYVRVPVGECESLLRPCVWDIWQHQMSHHRHCTSNQLPHSDVTPLGCNHAPLPAQPTPTASRCRRACPMTRCEMLVVRCRIILHYQEFADPSDQKNSAHCDHERLFRHRLVPAWCRLCCSPTSCRRVSNAAC